MPRSKIDPAGLEGRALERWYRRTPDQIQSEVWAEEEQAHKSFFGPTSTDEPSLQRQETAGVGRAVAGQEDVLWISNGRGGYRRIRAGRSADVGMPEDDFASASYLPDRAAAPEAVETLEIGNPHNRRLRREWEAANGRPWPRTKEGLRYDVAHKRAIADGGTNTLDNIRPMDPLEHKQSHREDQARWGRRAAIARAFGGKVEPPRAWTHKPVARGGLIRGGRWRESFSRACRSGWRYAGSV
jgi:hypothetical protein